MAVSRLYVVMAPPAKIERTNFEINIMILGTPVKFTMKPVTLQNIYVVDNELCGNIEHNNPK